MSANLYVIEDYENETAFRPKKTNPNKAKTKPLSKPVLSSACPEHGRMGRMGQFQMGRPPMDSRNYKKYLTLSLGADRICCVPEIICCNRNNEKGFQTCL